MGGDLALLAATTYEVLLQFFTLCAHSSPTSAVPRQFPLIPRERLFVFPMLAHAATPSLGAVHAAPRGQLRR
eukprot:4391770-Pyramimonas_sp.AAC.1